MTDNTPSTQASNRQRASFEPREATVTEYVNPWRVSELDPANFEARTAPKFPEYRGFLVFERGGGFGYVWNGWAITQRAGARRDAYKAVVDGLLDGSEYIHKQSVCDHLRGHADYKPQEA